MTSLLAAEPGEVGQCGLQLGILAEDVRAAHRGTAAAELAGWRSASALRYGSRLADLRQRLGRISDVYDESGELLLSYARSLAEAQELAQRGRAMEDAGSQLSAVRAMTTPPAAQGPDAGVALREQGRRLLAEAEGAERAAASRVALGLRDLADSAPAPRSGTGWHRFVDDLFTSAGDALVAVAHLPGQLVTAANTAADALSFGSRATKARHDVAALVDEFLHSYEAVEGWWNDGHRAGAAVGGLAGIVGPGKAGLIHHLPGRRPWPDSRYINQRLTPEGRPDYLFGIREGELTVDDLDEAWLQAHAEKPLRDRIHGKKSLQLPDVSSLTSGSIDLELQEAHGGHTISRHVGVRDLLLSVRIRLETAGRRKAARSTFPDLETAERLTSMALRDSPGCAEKLRHYLATVKQGDPLLSIRLHLDHEVGRVMNKDGVIQPGNEVVVWLDKRDDRLFISTSYLART